MSDCPRRWEVDVHREGRLGPRDAQSFERHLRTCMECRRARDAEQQLRDLAARIAPAEADELVMRRLRSRVLRDVALGGERPASRWALFAVAASFVLFVGAALAWWTQPAPTIVASTTPAPSSTMSAAAPSPEALAGTVVAVGVARWNQTRQGGLERVSLEEGTLSVHVRPQRFGERFLVALPDGELEVRGTTFRVTVVDGHTTRVVVDEGVVEVRPKDGPETRLEAGSSWSPPVSAATAASARPTKPSLSPSTATAPSSPTLGLGDDEYSAAMALLRSGRNGEAAAAFHAFVAAHPGAPPSEDASYLEAVALARAGRVDAAGLAAEHHLASYPASFHRKEAEALIARAAGPP